jgi:hypothetical protein
MAYLEISRATWILERLPMPHVNLTAKQEAYCQGIADGMGQADSYRAAYDAGDMKENSVYVNASKLMKNAKIAQRIVELRAGVQEKQLWSREMSVKALMQAFHEGTGAVKVAAVKELNVMHGYNEATKLSVDLKFKPITDEDWL